MCSLQRTRRANWAPSRSYAPPCVIAWQTPSSATLRDMRARWSSTTARCGRNGVAETRSPLPSILRRAPTQIRLDQQPRAAPEANAVDLQVFEHALDVVAGLGERDAFDPIDRIDFRITWVAIFGDPFLHAATAGIVAGEGQDMGAAVVGIKVAELGCTQLNVVALVAQQALFVEGGAEFLADVAPGLGGDLHQAHGAGAGDGPWVERALLAGDGVDHRRLDGRPDRAVLGNADGRKSVMIERQAAPERRLAEQHHGARVVMAGRDFRDRRKARGVVRGPLAEIGQRPSDQVTLVDGIKELDCAHDGVSCSASIGRGLRRRAQDQILVAEPGPRDLPVIGGGVARRRLVMRARLVSAAERLRRAALPVACA